MSLAVLGLISVLIFLVEYSLGNSFNTLIISGVLLVTLVVQLVLWIPFVGGITFLRDVPPLSFFLFSRNLPTQIQSQLGNYEPLKSAIDIQSTSPSTPLATKVVGTNEYYVIKPSSEFSSPEKAVEVEVTTMLEMSTVPETKNLPDNFQGVFWMKGNGMQEELAVMGLSTWDAKNKILTRMSGVTTWSWHDSEGGYRVAKAANEGSWDDKLGVPTGMTYFKFGDDFSNGRLWTSKSYDYSDVSWLYSLGHFSLEKGNFENGQTVYYRGCYWGGDWIEHDWGSYDLTRITTLDGTPVQPGYDEYVEHRKNLGLATLMLKGPVSTDSDKKEL